MEHCDCSVVSRLSINWDNTGSIGRPRSEGEVLMPPLVMFLPRDDLPGIQWAKQSCKGCNVPLQPLLINEPAWLVPPTLGAGEEPLQSCVKDIGPEAVLGLEMIRNRSG